MADLASIFSPLIRWRLMQSRSATSITWSECVTIYNHAILSKNLMSIVVVMTSFIDMMI